MPKAVNAKEPIVPTNELLLRVQGDTFWEEYLRPLRSLSYTQDRSHPTNNRNNQESHQSKPSFRVHLAVMVEPYLRLILEGKKTIESRFSTRKFAPYDRASKGDVVLLKKSSGAITGICQITESWFFETVPDLASNLETLESIKRDFELGICPQGLDFWEERSSDRYVSLMRVANVKALDPIEFIKRDRRGWVVLYAGSLARSPNSPVQLELEFANSELQQ